MARHSIKDFGDEIKSLYLSGETVKAIAERFQYSESSVRQYCCDNAIKRPGIKIRKVKNKISKEKERELCNLYLSDPFMTMTAVGKRVNLRLNTVHKYLKKNKIEITKNGRDGFRFDLDYFSTIDSEEKAYWLGFSMGDCTITDNKKMGRFSLKLAKKDIKHLEKIKQCMKSTHRIYSTKNEKNFSIFAIGSRKLVKDLAKWGIVPRKSHKTQTPNIDPSLLVHFFRGCIDADGWVTVQNGNKSYAVGLSGTERLLKACSLFVSANISRVKLRTIYTTPSTHEITWGGRLQAYEVASLFYKNATIYLDRKYKKYKELERGQEEHLKKHPKICIHNNCDEPVYAKCLCKVHYGKERNKKKALAKKAAPFLEGIIPKPPTPPYQGD